ncbi:hypothetical protein [Pseudanabaena sp. SR411]|uniref:hypothetical protein n=1 Tax=Pseudanabaena sp. SR411 TaxID=1980935 RepID=UPI001595B436|nr:hypothetical protein [Pseudanabaena sp. SR411]
MSLIVISERLNISAIAILDSNFGIYHCDRKQPFEREFLTTNYELRGNCNS